ncbi:sporulation protein [Clostridium estertheticum]|uniref:GerW family sporulation protein n=1 Tax=Clostridium estertheticum TaxID=238834 RepID=UPI001CF20881|nr:spore germination protein GerW family protein [Clostridium estertheticum]MCB2305505.1 sporulation protein [Clostridium estertheticum]MCB2343944.1 sporulation protein [Clostridium estertheticum]MCB2348861.1 sporulation protein [Clostridium estertheticum]WAG46181.1 sporulation protein [Clostridium estertheticum]
MINMTENAEALFSNLERFLKTETVVGEAIIVGETTLIPLITVSFGCGTGGGTGNTLKDGEGTGGGLGAGAKITPTAILVIKDGNVTMLSIKGKCNLENLIQMVPGLVSKVSSKMGGLKNKTDKNKMENDI